MNTRSLGGRRERGTGSSREHSFLSSSFGGSSVFEEGRLAFSDCSYSCGYPTTLLRSSSILHTFRHLGFCQTGSCAYTF